MKVYFSKWQPDPSGLIGLQDDKKIDVVILTSEARKDRVVFCKNFTRSLTCVRDDIGGVYG